MQKINGRIAFLDIARALCVLWIVSFWHMNSYLETSIRFFEFGTPERENLGYITNGVLALFTFISGFFISQNDIAVKRDVWAFYKKRIVRFMIPLFVSCVMLSCGGYIKFHHIFTICLGVSQFLPPPYPRTLWYFSMIIFFYAVTPVILRLRNQKHEYGILICIIITLFLLIGNRFLFWDRRLADNFVFYSLPFLFRNPKSISNFIMYKWNYLFVFLIFLIALLLPKNSNFFIGFAINASICYIILVVSKAFSNFDVVSNFFSVVAYASMFAYLYHRELYTMVKSVVGFFSYIEAIICVFILFFVSYLGQVSYNRFVNKWIYKA